ncbi:inhibin alpha chain [Sorex fumeus]|uniref:inhibin alpha chain n=1 Tax=Sorex fumeus TaxID=62283 RepID=UPI0024ADF123|nr:inhibin alpha chain [Sorex fumeus]
MRSQLSLPLWLLLLLAPPGDHGCQEPELDRELVLAKVRALFLDALGPPAVPREGGNPGIRRLPRRHTMGRRVLEPEVEDVSQAILFPATGTGCEDEPGAQDAEEGLFTYVFRPSQHTLSRQVTSAQLWFHTGLDRQAAAAAANSSEELLGLLALSSGGPQAVPTTSGRAPSRWAVLHLPASALPLLAQPVLVLMVRCPLCPCSARPEATPFLVAHTQARAPSTGDRARRSTLVPWPWTPSALRLLQRPPEELALHTNCHRAALNISFQELGWERWIVYPPSFIFYYCHGSCGLPPAPPDLPLPAPGGVPPTPPTGPLSLLPGIGAQACCAALPGTMRPLHVRTTSDGGYSFKYETVPNLLTQHCACI